MKGTKRAKPPPVELLAVELNRRAELGRKPATDEQLARLWPAWNALPAEMLPERRRQILLGKPPSPGPDRENYTKLRRRFRYLPFCKFEYKQALDAAVAWSDLIRRGRIFLKQGSAGVEAQICFSTFDDTDEGYVAIYRTAKELAITHPGLLEMCAPSLADINHLRFRYGAYLRARLDAIALVAPIVFVPGLKSKARLSFEGQTFGDPGPEPNFPLHIYIARLAAFGKCSPARLAEFFAERFLRLSRPQKEEFCNEYHRPTIGRQRYTDPLLPVWLADNAPLFAAFKSRWQSILEAAQRRFISNAREGCRSCPGDADALKVFWKDIENTFWPKQPRRITPPTGRPPAYKSPSLPDALLTPVPTIPFRNAKG
jgi:hypothetical protein